MRNVTVRSHFPGRSRADHKLILNQFERTSDYFVPQEDLERHPR